MNPQHTFRLFNTLTNRVDPVEPVTAGQLNIYSCGPTVYSYAHIGNFRTFVTADLIVRVARAIGLQTRHVTNITDVGHLTEDDIADAAGEDRMARALRSQEGSRFANAYDLARFYATAYLDDWKQLRLHDPEVRPRATEHVSHQIRAVERLIESGNAYETSQGIYFSVASFADYGKLSGNREAESLEEAEREVVVDEEKRDRRDFALWKKDPKHLMQWYSPWGWGFPGWHIECSVMAREYLGDELDIHAGGEDLIFPHHECEIAQSESLTNRPFARHWVHTRFLQVEGERMAKSKGNFFTVRDLITPVADGGRGVDPLALRLALISGHYRKPYNFTFDTLKASSRHIARIREAHGIASAAASSGDEGSTDMTGDFEKLRDAALSAMLDDLNTPEAIAAVLEGVKLVMSNSSGMSRASGLAALAWFDSIDDILGIGVATEAGSEQSDDLAAEVEYLLDERTRARANRDFMRADEIRDQLVEMGIEIMDGAEGTRWRKKSTLE